VAEREIQKTRILGKDKDIALERLTNGYANSVIDMESFERRVSVIENAIGIDEIESAISDIPIIESHNVNRDSNISEVEKIKNHGSSKAISGSLLQTKRLEIDIAHCVLSFDYRNLDLPSGVYDIILKSVHSVCTFLIPDDFTVDHRANETYSSYIDRNGNSGKQNRRIVLRISGELIHSSIKIKRPREKLIIRILKKII